jgi:hypothetical protein
MTNESQIKEYETLSNRVADALEGLNGAMEKLNDQSVLHTNAINNNTEAFRRMEEALKENKKVFITLGYIITVGLLLLAGAEKITEIL